jgi:hypothetical protein
MYGISHLSEMTSSPDECAVFNALQPRRPGSERETGASGFAGGDALLNKDALLLRAAQTRRLMQAAGLMGIRTACFLLLPFRSTVSRRVERAFRRLALTAQYISIGERLLDQQDAAA